MFVTLPRLGKVRRFLDCSLLIESICFQVISEPVRALIVASCTSTFTVTDAGAAPKLDKDIFRVWFKIPYPIHRDDAKYAVAIKVATQKGFNTPNC